MKGSGFPFNFSYYTHNFSNGQGENFHALSIFNITLHRIRSQGHFVSTNRCDVTHFIFMFALCLLLGFVGKQDEHPELTDLLDTWEKFRDFLKNFRVDIHFYATGVGGWLLDKVLDCLSGKGLIGVTICAPLAPVHEIVNKITDRLRQIGDKDVENALDGENSYYQIVVCLEDMKPNFPFRLDKLWNQRIVMFTSIGGKTDKLKTLSGEALEQAENELAVDVLVELSKVLRTLMLTHVEKDKQEALGKLLAVKSEGSGDAVRAVLPCNIYISGSGFAKHADYLALTNGRYYIQNVQVPCCYAGLGCTFELAEGQSPSIFCDYVMTDIFSYKEVLASDGAMFKNFGIIGSASLTPVSAVTYNKDSWYINAGLDNSGTVLTSKVQGQLSVMLISLFNKQLNVTVKRANQGDIQVQELNLSVQSLISSGLMPDFTEVVNMFSSGSSMRVTFDDTWTNSQQSVSVILESDTEEDIEIDGGSAPSSVTVKRTRISDRPKAPGPYFKLKDWQIALISIGTILVVGYTTILLWAMFIRKKQPVPTWEHSEESAPTTTGTGGISITNNNNNNNNNQMGMMMMGAAPRLQP